MAVLSHSQHLIEQVAGIEPVSPAWEAGILPMYYTCICRPYYSRFRKRLQDFVAEEKRPKKGLSYENSIKYVYDWIFFINLSIMHMIRT